MGDFHPLNANHTEHTRPKAYSTNPIFLIANHLPGL